MLLIVLGRARNGFKYNMILGIRKSLSATNADRPQCDFVTRPNEVKNV